MLIEWIFGKMFSGYVFQFSAAEDRVMLMNDPTRREYFRKAKELVENGVYSEEMKDLIRKYYKELALKTGSKLEMQSYRLTLKALQELDGRFRQLATMYKSPSITKSTDKL
jgi:hypothetical protein